MQLEDVVQFIPKTIQGEGKRAGHICTLLRFKKCLRSCPFCDTTELMKQECLPITIDRVADAVKDTHMLLITGGEPLIYLPQIALLVQYISISHSIKVDLETAGPKNNKAGKLSLTQIHKYLRIINQNTDLNIVFSPKIFNDRDLCEACDFLRIIKDFKFTVKVLVPFTSDHVKYFLYHYKTMYSEENLYFMPMGQTKEELEKNIPATLETVYEYGGNFTHRLHLLTNMP